MGSATGIQTALLIFFQSIGGQSDDGSRRILLFLFPVTDQPGCGISIHNGHLHVHENKVVAVVFEQVERLLAIFRNLQAVWGMFEISPDQHGIFAGILRHQDRESFLFRRRARVSARACSTQWIGAPFAACVGE